jgi:fermentation-respiration switch protein FrsA (DUF1100 family)
MQRRRLGLVVVAIGLMGGVAFVWPAVVNSLLYFPSRAIDADPSEAGLAFSDLEIATADGERLHGWWIPAPRPPAVAHVLFFHGNGGNIAHRIAHARVLADAGLDVLLFDYRGYGRSTGSPGEQGTYTDARAALGALRARPGVRPGGIVYLGESLGGAVAAELAIADPPAALVLQSTFASIRRMARLHYPVVPAPLVPDLYPTIDRIARVRAPVLVIHGDGDEIVPLDHGRALHAAALEPKRLDVVRGAGHNDLLLVAGRAYGESVAAWAREARRFPGP